MSKKDFIALANAIREHNVRPDTGPAFTEEQLTTLSDFCHRQNANFKGQRWRDYIAGKCGPSGGRVAS